jgi:hypothetical protein
MATQIPRGYFSVAVPPHRAQGNPSHWLDRNKRHRYRDGRAVGGDGGSCGPRSEEPDSRVRLCQDPRICLLIQSQCHGVMHDSLLRPRFRFAATFVRQSLKVARIGRFVAHHPSLSLSCAAATQSRSPAKTTTTTTVPSPRSKSFIAKASPFLGLARAVSAASTGHGIHTF